jgi:hypothetical protein
MIIEGRVKHGIFVFLSLATVLMLMAALTAPAWTECSATVSPQTITVKFSLSGITTTTETTGSPSQSGFVSYKDQDTTYGGSSNCAKTAMLVYILAVVAILLSGLTVLVYIPSRNRKDKHGDKIKTWDHLILFMMFCSMLLTAASVGHFNMNLTCLTKVQSSTFTITGASSSSFATTLVG